ncbi:MAG: ExbD/TolR family protein [Mariniblastus sp.]
MPLKIHRDDQTSINLTPMIDIVFLLIIFFMVSSRFSELGERDIALQVPAVTNAKALTAAPRKRVINVYRDGRILLDKKTVSMEGLTSELVSARQQYQKLGVVIRGEGDGRYANVAEVINACRQANVNVTLAVRDVQMR